MKLQRYDLGSGVGTGGWRDFDYETGSFVTAGPASTPTFTTGDGGVYRFMNGLPAGYYRVIEISAPEDYENIYTQERAGEGQARVFAVPGSGSTVTLYNPARTSLTLKKTDLEGNPLEGAVLSLKRAGEEGSIISQSSVDGGKVVFENIPSGSYWLDETAAPEGWSSAYFALLNPDLGDLLDQENGVFLGNTVEGGKTSIGNTEPVVTSRSEITDIDTVKNAAQGSFTLEKVDSNDQAEKLPGAVFTVSYKAFDNLESVVFSDAGFTVKGDYTTGQGGTVAVTGDPGIYKIVETTAPGGYQKDEAVRYVVLTGGLGVTVTGLPETGLTDPRENIVVANRKTVSITVTKTVEGYAGETYTGSASFTFTLFDQ